MLGGLVGPVVLLVAAPSPTLALGDYHLQRRGDGYIYEDVRFTATIAGDGTVTFSDRRKVETGLDRLRSHTAEKMRQEEEKKLLPPTRPDARRDDVRPAKDFFVEQNPTAPLTTVILPRILSVRAHVDVTDEYLRFVGRDPYRREKAAFLAATADLRVRMATDSRARGLAESLNDLPHALEALWNNPRFSRSEKVQILRLLHEECADGPDGDGARRAIEDFGAKYASEPGKSPARLRAP